MAPQWNTMPYFKDINTIFIHIPKNAGTSIVTSISKHLDDNGLSPGVHPIRKHEPALNYLYGMNKQTFLKCNKFSVIRNPLDRLVSWYFYNKDFWNNKENLPTLETYNCYSSSCKNKFIESDFNSWIKELTDYGGEGACKDTTCPFHITAAQHLFLVDRAGKILVSSVLRYENLSTEWEHFSSYILKTDNPPKLSTKNKGTYGKHYLEYYSKGSVKIAKDIYKKDFEYFNYKL